MSEAATATIWDLPGRRANTYVVEDARPPRGHPHNGARYSCVTVMEIAADGERRLAWHSGPRVVGKTDHCGYAIARDHATLRAAVWNAGQECEA